MKLVYSRVFSIWPTMSRLHVGVFIVILVASLTSFGIAGDVRYIYGSPRGLLFNEHGRADATMPWQILRMADDNKRFVVEFSIEPDGYEPFGQMYYYSDLDLFLLVDGGGVPTSYKAVSLSEQRVLKTIPIDRRGNAWNQRVYTAFDSIRVLAVDIRYNGKDNLSARNILTIDNGIDLSRTDKSLLSIHIAGPGSAYTSGSSDVLRLVRPDDTTLVCSDSLIFINLPPIPTGTITTESVHTFTMIALRDEALAVLVVPDELLGETIELLLCDRVNREWKSVTIPGTESIPRLINGMLVATIADRNPGTNPSIYKGLPALKKETAVIISPKTGASRSVTLGHECEVLWLRGDTITYRTGSQLVEGTIDADNNVNEIWSLDDARIRHIHWAFWSDSSE